MMRAVVLAAVLLVLGTDVGAQAIVGRVLDETTRDPVAGALVELLEVGGRRVSGSESDEAGLFHVAAPLPGTYVLRLRRLGYAEHTSRPLELRRGELVELEFEVAPEGVKLDPIVVLSRRDTEPGRDQFERRRARERGVFLDADDIEARNPRTPVEALQGVPGVLLTPMGTGDGGDVRWAIRATRGWQCLVVFLDHAVEPVVVSMDRSGVLMRSGVGTPRGGLTNPGSGGLRSGRGHRFIFSPSGDLNEQVVDPRNLRGIEVYRTYAEVPEELRRTLRISHIWQDDYLGPCGLVLVWTGVGW
jgi:hypothetical protein